MIITIAVKVTAGLQTKTVFVLAVNNVVKKIII